METLKIKIKNQELYNETVENLEFKLETCLFTNLDSLNGFRGSVTINNKQYSGEFGLYDFLDDYGFIFCEYTYDIHFHDAENSNNKGFSATKEYCLDWINTWNDGNSYEKLLGYIPEGIIQIVCNETEEVVFETSIK